MKRDQVNSNKKPTIARGIPQPFNRQARSVGQFKPVVAQLKTPISTQSIKRPVAPPVYHPQATPKAAQRKMLNPAANRTPPVAPSRLTIQQKSARGRAVIQRYCRAPGCNDPLCHDESNHGIDRVFGLRGRNVYSRADVGPGDVGGGTGTNPGVRQYVNSPAAQFPQEIRISFAAGGVDGNSSFPNYPLAPGQRADAGHIFGRQYGGIGNQNAAVFPQHPQTNRGNSYQGEPTRELWRGPEDAVRGQAQAGNPVDVSVALYNVPRPRIRQCPGCNRDTFTSAANCPYCGAVLP
jgi:hypothetical protein